MKTVGFSVAEKMNGTALRVDAVERERFSFEVVWGSNSVSSFAHALLTGRPALAPLEGTVDAGSLTRGPVPCQGHIDVDYSKGTIKYEFMFFDDRSRLLEYVGRKSGIKLWNLPWSHTRCSGAVALVSSNELVATTESRFRLLDLPSLVWNAKLERRKR